MRIYIDLLYPIGYNNIERVMNMGAKPSVFKTGMYISIEKKYMRVIESDRYLFKCNLQRSEEEDPRERYAFSVNSFLNRVFMIMCDEVKIDDVVLSNRRKRESEHMTIKINNAILKKMKEAGIYAEGDSDTRRLAAFYRRYIEEYASRSQTERERIFYKNVIEEFKSMKENMVMVIRRNAEPFTARILRYEIIDAPENGHLYITGFTVKKNEEGRFVYGKPINIPIYKVIPYDENVIFANEGEIDLKKDIVFDYPTIDCYKAAIDSLKDRLNDDGVLYISGIRRRVKVRLSDEGLENLYSRVQFRPNDLKISKSDSHIIEFEATWLQTFLYFFKFGSDAEILEPDVYRELFRQRYESAFGLYSS